MGRKIPLANSDPSQAFHQTFSVPVFLAGMAAVMAIVSLLCGVRSRRKSESSHSTYKPAEKNMNTNTNTNTNTNSPLSPPPTAMETPEVAEQTEGAAVIEIDELDTDIEESQKNLTQKKTPGKQIKETFSSKNLLRKSASTRNLAKNLSMKMTRSMSMAGRDLQDRMKKGKLKPEESVWMKTIILGEKCKVADGEEAIIYERKGNKIAAYHPKTSNTLIDQNAIRSQDPQNGDFKDFSG